MALLPCLISCHLCEKSTRELRNSHHLTAQRDNIHARTHVSCMDQRGYMMSGWVGVLGLRAKQAGINHWTQSWSAVVMVMTLSSPFNQCDFSVSGEAGDSLFSKNVYSPSLFLGPHPLPSQGFRFALESSPLAIISCEQPNLPLVFFVRAIQSRSRTDSLSVRISRAINK